MFGWLFSATRILTSWPLRTTRARNANLLTSGSSGALAQQLVAVRGAGTKTATVLIAQVPELEKFNRCEIAALAGWHR